MIWFKKGKGVPPPPPIQIKMQSRSGGGRADLLLLLSAVLLCHAQLTVGAEKGVSVTLAARWQGTPLMLEAAEMLVRRSSSSFFRFIENGTVYVLADYAIRFAG